MKPGIYTEFANDLYRQARRHQSHTFHTVLGLNPPALASLLLRTLGVGGWKLSQMIREGDIEGGSLSALFGWVCVGWCLLVAFKGLLGFGIRFVARTKVAALEAAALRKRGGAA